MKKILIKNLPQKRKLISIAPDARVRWATKVMKQHNIGALAVVDQGKLVGIISERDIVRRCLADDLKADQTICADIMTIDPITLTVDQSILNALAIMMENNIRHIPIECEKGNFCRMLSVKDVIYALRKSMEKHVLNMFLEMADESSAA